MGQSLVPRLVIAFLVILIAGGLLVVLIVRPPGTLRPRPTEPAATVTPVAAPTQTAIRPTATPEAGGSSGVTATPGQETSATPGPPSPVTITMTQEELTSLVKEWAESADTSELPIYDPVVYITEEHIELTAVTSGPLGDMDVLLIGVPAVESGEVHLRVTSATVGGIPLPRQVTSQIERELDDTLSEWLSGGAEVQELTLGEGQITVVVLP